MKKLLTKIRKILRDRRTRQFLTRFVSFTAALVVFVTTYALVLPAITMEREAYCGIPAHQHDDSCYETVLICDIPEDGEHQHTESCYEKKLICSLEVHTHLDACYSDELQESEVILENDNTFEIEDSQNAKTVSADGQDISSASADYAKTDSITDDEDMDTDSESNIDLTSKDAIEMAESQEFNEIEEKDETETSTGENGTIGADAGFYTPALEALDFNTILTSSTGIYYYHKANEAEEDNGDKSPVTSVDITEWEPVDENTILAPEDLIRVYLRYSVPAGQLNNTNAVARYRLPANLVLSEEQADTINSTENGISAQYIDADTLQVMDPDTHEKYLGVEAVEGTRTPDQD